MSKVQNLIRKKSLYHLAIREHSSFELKKKLLRAGFDDKDISLEIAALKQENLLSDERFCEILVRSRKSAGFGPIKIAFELSRHELNLTLIHQYLDEKSEIWSDLATKTRIKKFGNKLPIDWKEKARQMRFLQSRGFTLEHINTAMNDLM